MIIEMFLGGRENKLFSVKFSVKVFTILNLKDGKISRLFSGMFKLNNRESGVAKPEATEWAELMFSIVRKTVADPQ